MVRRRQLRTTNLQIDVYLTRYISRENLTDAGPTLKHYYEHRKINNSNVEFSSKLQVNIHIKEQFKEKRYRELLRKY